MACNLPIIVSRDEGGRYSVESVGRRARRLNWEEMLGVVASLSHPSSAEGHPALRGAGSEPTTAAKTISPEPHPNRDRDMDWGW